MKDLLTDFEFNISKGKIEVLFNYFFNSTILSLILFALSIMYIYLTEENKKIKSLFVWYALIVLAIIWNPVFIHIFENFINFASLYRLYYMLPMYPSICYMFTKIVKKYSKTWQKLLCLVVICIPIVVFGRNVYQEFELQEFNNWYKLPDETIYVANTIFDDTKYQIKKAIVPYGMSSQIQQIYPQIELLYTRIVTNEADENGNPSPSDSDNPSSNQMISRISNGDTVYIAEICNKENINYIAIYDSTELSEPLENYEFEVIGSDMRSKSL